MYAIRLIFLLAISSFVFAFHPAVSEAMVVTAEGNVVGEVTGVITGALDGEPFVNFTVHHEPFPGEEFTTAEWLTYGFGDVELPIEVTLIGFVEGYTGLSAWRNSVWVEFYLNHDLELILEEDYTVTFAERIADPFVDENATIKITYAEWLSETEFAISGTFTATLTHAYDSDVAPKIIEGEFEIYRVSQDDPFM